MAQSYKQQLAAAIARRDALNVKIEELTPLAAAEPDVSVDLSTFINTTVFARVGRCTTNGGVPKIVQAIVLAAKQGEGKAPDQLKITYGEGFDAEICTVPVTAVSTTLEGAEAALAGVIADYKKAKEAAEKAAAAAEVAADAVEAAASDE